ncbi:MAG: FKBP-type peptidyl-prolyl cis-trans isomerase [bacterium]|nr:FKBP-type peptidyl-prolyl cis-trans isomerase [bacterium]
MGPTTFINLDKLEAGFIDGVNEKASRVSDDAFQGMKESINAEADRLQAAKAEKDAELYKGNKEAGEKFLAENAKKPGVKVTESGLQYEVLKAGSGPKPSATSRVTVHYHGTTIDGAVFDSSVDRGEPATFGVNQVIKGWTEALQLMPKGAKYKLYIPQELAYGATPQPGGPIEPYEALIFEVELLEIQ